MKGMKHNHQGQRAGAGAALHRVKRFDGMRPCAERNWDGVRKDDDMRDGDCFVYFCSRDAPRRRHALRVPLELLERSDSRRLLDDCLLIAELPSPAGDEDDDDAGGSDSADSGYGASITSEHDSPRCALYVPAPPHASPRDALAFHLGTRNYCAFLRSKPLLGESLGAALADLAARVEVWQPAGLGPSGFLDYCRSQGYCDFAGNPDRAAAGLVLAERARIANLWSDAFVHCVGMNDALDASPEAAAFSSTTRERVRSAAGALNRHVSRTTAALADFLADELGPEFLGLSEPLRDHLDRFRSTLHASYVRAAGYFPPDPAAPWDERIWSGMYDDFHCLYEYLADTDSSSGDIVGLRGQHGGVCVVQNLQAIERRHGFDPLPHPLCRLPDPVHMARAAAAHRGLRGLRRGSLAFAPAAAAHLALAQATNREQLTVTQNQLVREYMRFEASPLEERVSPIEARKVRWILVCAVLHMLISITRAPPEVRDTSCASYPLCVRDAPLPPWTAPSTSAFPPSPSSRTSPELPLPFHDSLSIRPDCDADSADDYFAAHNVFPVHRSNSDSSLSASLLPASAPSPSPSPSPASLLRRASTQTASFARTASLRSTVVGSFQRSVVDGLAIRRSAQRKPFPTHHILHSQSSLCRDLVAESEPASEEVAPARVDLSSSSSSSTTPPPQLAAFLPASQDGAVPALTARQQLLNFSSSSLTLETDTDVLIRREAGEASLPPSAPSSPSSSPLQNLGFRAGWERVASVSRGALFPRRRSGAAAAAIAGGEKGVEVGRE